MTTARCGCGLGALPHGIYAVGGFNEGALASVGKYDIDNGQWTAAANMKTKRYNMGVVALHDSKLIAVGGNDDRGRGAPTGRILRGCCAQPPWGGVKKLLGRAGASTAVCVLEVSAEIRKVVS